mmetsp:Transcript_32393/g.112046  ORF Transcript_32393/g.112046 Transcript_32393/m.112046 type:complete len:277 (-) Transcript_32393:264-1094(-)
MDSESPIAVMKRFRMEVSVIASASAALSDSAAAEMRVAAAADSCAAARAALEASVVSDRIVSVDDDVAGFGWSLRFHRSTLSASGRLSASSMAVSRSPTTTSFGTNENSVPTKPCWSSTLSASRSSSIRGGVCSETLRSAGHARSLLDATSSAIRGRPAKRPASEKAMSWRPLMPKCRDSDRSGAGRPPPAGRVPQTRTSRRRGHSNSNERRCVASSSKSLSASSAAPAPRGPSPRRAGRPPRFLGRSMGDAVSCLARRNLSMCSSRNCTWMDFMM